MKRILAVMVMSAVLLCAGTAMAKTLKIGSLSPLTGPYAADGNDIANGARAAIAVIEAQGGIPGFDKIQLLPEDSACDPRQAVAAANKLVNTGVVGVVGAYCSSATIPASDVLAEEDVIMITPASTNPQVTERGLAYMYRMCGRDDDQGPAAVKFMTDHLKAKSVFIVDDKTTYSQGLATEVATHARENGIKILAHDHVNQGDRDFSAVLTKVKQANPDVFYVSLQNSSSGALMLMQAKRVGINAAIMGQDAVYHPQLMEIARDAAEGAFLTFGYTDKSTPEFQTFYEAYTKISGEPGAYSAYAYDSAIVLLTAIKNAGGSTDPQKIKAELAKMDLKGASKQIKFRENGDSGSEYIIFKVQDGQFVPFWNPTTGSTM
jgi:branched-chain amino acid transport system substrate-binding protein